MAGGVEHQNVVVLQILFSERLDGVLRAINLKHAAGIGQVGHGLLGNRQWSPFSLHNIVIEFQALGDEENSRLDLRCYRSCVVRLGLGTFPAKQNCDDLHDDAA